MSGQIKVDFGSLAELQSQVSSAAQKILTEIEDIKRTVNGTQAYWEGAARDQFDHRSEHAFPRHGSGRKVLRDTAADTRQDFDEPHQAAHVFGGSGRHDLGTARDVALRRLHDRRLVQDTAIDDGAAGDRELQGAHRQAMAEGDRHGVDVVPGRRHQRRRDLGDLEGRRAEEAGSTAITRAPAAAAIITADSPTPPQPCTASH